RPRAGERRGHRQTSGSKRLSARIIRWRRETSEADQPVERGHPAHQGRYSSDDKKFDGIPIAWKETAGYSTVSSPTSEPWTNSTPGCASNPEQASPVATKNEDKGRLP